MNENQPLILVFYIDKTTITTPEIIQPFINSVNEMVERKNANIITFFVPAAEGTHERIEAINPIMVAPAEMDKINKIVEDIKRSFDIGQGADDFIGEFTDGDEDDN
jgi:hypothetical protein